MSKLEDLEADKRRLQEETRTLRIEGLRLRLISILKYAQICWLRFVCWIIGVDKQ